MNSNSGDNSSGLPNLNIFDPQVMYVGQRRIGVCSICGGAVLVHDGPWYGTQPPVPTCASCGAVRQEDRGPVIPMVPTRRYRGFDTDWYMPPSEPLHLLIYNHEQLNSGNSHGFRDYDDNAHS
jgi:hypothetical protein